MCAHSHPLSFLCLLLLITVALPVAAVASSFRFQIAITPGYGIHTHTSLSCLPTMENDISSKLNRVPIQTERSIFWPTCFQIIVSIHHFLLLSSSFFFFLLLSSSFSSPSSHSPPPLLFLVMICDQRLSPTSTQFRFALFDATGRANVDCERNN